MCVIYTSCLNKTLFKESILKECTQKYSLLKLLNFKRFHCDWICFFLHPSIQKVVRYGSPKIYSVWYTFIHQNSLSKYQSLTAIYSHHRDYNDMKFRALDFQIWLSLKSRRSCKIQHSDANCWVIYTESLSVTCLWQHLT